METAKGVLATALVVVGVYVAIKVAALWGADLDRVAAALGPRSNGASAQ